MRKTLLILSMLAAAAPAAFAAGGQEGDWEVGPYAGYGGHTDSTGSDAHNRALSQRRAEAVHGFLAARGVDSSRLTAKGYGESRPIADNAAAEGRARNRRVELTRLD